MKQLIQITDFHLQAEPHLEFHGVLPEVRLGKVLSTIAHDSQSIDLLLMTGDIAHHGYADAYKRVMARIAALNVGNARWLAGNHDDASLMQQLGQQSRDKLSCSVTDLEEWVLITLDSSAQPDGKGSGALSSVELEKLSRLLVEYSDRYICLALHHNPVALGSLWQHEIMLSNADAFWQVLAPHSQVKLVLCGHLHQEHQVEKSGVTLLSTPAIAPQFKKGAAGVEREQAEPLSLPAYRQIKLYPNGCFDTKVYRVEA